MQVTGVLSMILEGLVPFVCEKLSVSSGKLASIGLVPSVGFDASLVALSMSMPSGLGARLVVVDCAASRSPFAQPPGFAGDD